ncbi:MAG: outer membrane protein assembly factor BamD [Bacteroidia bacterium]
MRGPLRILGGLILLMLGCDPYAKLAKSRKLADRDSAAMGYMRKKRYESAILIMEELVNLYRGTPRAEEMLYHLAQAKKALHDYTTAAYYYEQLTQNFPLGKYTEESYFEQGYLYFLASLDYDLDQSETERAIQKLEVYLTLYPEGKFVPQAEKSLEALRLKLAKKLFMQAQLFLRIGRYRAALTTYQNFISQYPDTPWLEEAYFRRAQAALRMAQFSTPEKQKERFETAQEYYLLATEKYPTSMFLKSTQNIYDDVRKKLRAL